MKKKTIISVLMTLVMIFTVIPGFAFAEKDLDFSPFKSSYKEKADRKASTAGKRTPQSIFDDFKDEVLWELEWDYSELISAESKYIPEIWKEINTSYEEGRQNISKAKNLDELFEAYGVSVLYLEVLGELTTSKVKKASDISKLKTTYRDKIESTFKKLKKTNYNAYYWNMIMDARDAGKNDLKRATTFRDVASFYVDTIYTMKYGAYTKKQFAKLQAEYINVLKRYINIGLDAKEYDKATWSKVQKTYKDAVAKIKKQSSGEKVHFICEDASASLYAITKVKVLWYEWYEYIDQLLDKLDEKLDQFFSGDYTERGEDKAFDIEDEAFEGLVEAVTKEEANKLYKDAVKKLNEILTIKQIKAFKKSQPKTVKVAKKNHSSVKFAWSGVKNASGYVVYMATNAKGKYKKVGTISGTKKRNLTVKKLKSNKKYYFKVRAVNNKAGTYYSKYSKRLVVKTSKKK